MYFFVTPKKDFFEVIMPEIQSIRVSKQHVKRNKKKQQELNWIFFFWLVTTIANYPS